ncbi:MAG: glycoside hydrolase family 19 protein [Candidatus Nitrosotenuis sp.]
MITPEQIIEIMPNCPRGVISDYAQILNESMAEGKINTVVRSAAFLGQIAHESGDLRLLVEQSNGKEYEGRRDLGNIKAGDGPMFKGRGPIQLTGRANYRRAGNALGLPLEEQPSLVEQPRIGFRTTVFYWTDHKLNELADKLDYLAITRAINGGLNGYSHRLEKIVLALGVIGRDVKI